jgi:hypothetical protein
VTDGLVDEDRLRAGELCLERGIAVLQEHGDHLTQVSVQLVEAVPLAVGPGEPGHLPDEDAGLRISLDDSSVSAHMR